MVTKKLLYISAFFFYCLSAQSQPLVSNDHSDVNNSIKAASKLILVIEEDISEWTFFSDGESNILYVDFSTIAGKIESINVNQGTANYFSDDVQELKKNTFYELDLQNYRPGFYEVEVTTTEGVISKEIILE